MYLVFYSCNNFANFILVLSSPLTVHQTYQNFLFSEANPVEMSVDMFQESAELEVDSRGQAEDGGGEDGGGEAATGHVLADRTNTIHTDQVSRGQEEDGGF